MTQGADATSAGAGRSRTEDVLWAEFRAAYDAVLQDRAHQPPPEDPVAAYTMRLTNLAIGVGLGDGESALVMRFQKRLPAHLEGRGRRLAVKLVGAFASEPGGLPGALTRAARSGGFESVRDHLESRGLTRAVVWRLCLALRHAALLTADPDRPYLDRRALRVAQRLLKNTGVRPQSPREWEAAVILEADARLASGMRPPKLDAEIVTLACVRLAP